MRTITPRHIAAYQNGCLKKLFEVVKQDPELSFEIRKDNEVMIYYRKGKALTIRYSDTDDYPKKITPLDRQYNNGHPLPEWFDAGHLASTLNHTSRLREYFKMAKRLIHKHKLGLEFSVQQNIAAGNRSFDKRFLVVDMEWQPDQSAVDKSERIGKPTRIDLVVVDTRPNDLGTNDIYLTELKVGTGATEGKSGIADHIKKTKEITDNAKVCDDLKRDVESIIDIKSRLGLIEGKKELQLSPKPKMMIILAYRGKEEQLQLEKQARIAIEESLKAGMDEPLVKKYDLQITLE